MLQNIIPLKGDALKDYDYKSIFKNNSQPMMIHNLKGEIVDINDSLLRMIGYSRDDFKDVKMENLIGREVEGENFNLINLLKKTVSQGSLKVKFIFIKKDKKTFLGEVTAKTIIMSSGLNVLMLIDNVTEHKILEDNLKKEKELADTIIKSAPNIIVGLGANSEIIIFNKFAEKLTGYDSKDVVGKKWIDIFIPKEEKEAVNKAWKGVIKNKKSFDNFVNSIVTKNGEKRLISWNNACINCNKGKFRMVLSIGDDITESTAFQKALRESEERYRKLFYNSPNVNMVISPEGIVIDINDKVHELTGYLSKELIGKNIFKLPFVNKTNRNLIAEKFEKRKKGVEIKPYAIELTGKKGQRILLMVSGNPIFDEKKNLTKLIVSFTEIIKN